MTILALVVAMFVEQGQPTYQPRVQWLLFSTQNCIPCQRLKGKLSVALTKKSLGWKMSEKQSAHIRTVEDAKFPDLVQKWEVEAFPTMILVVDGKEEERVLGDIDPAWMGRVFNAASQKIISQEGKLLP